MTTETPNVGDPNREGAGGNQPPVSSEARKPIEGAPVSPQELLQLRQKVDQQERELRGLQSRQDKDKTETQRILEGIEKRMAAGASFDEARSATLESQRAEQKDDLIYRMAQKILGDSSPSVAGNSVTVTDDAARVIEKAQLSASDPQVIELARQFPNQVDFAMQLGSYKEKLASRPPPDASAAPAMPPSGPTPTASVEGLTQEYQEKLFAARGNATLFKELKEQYRKKGVPVDGLVVT